MFHSMPGNANYLICLFIITNENVKIRENHKNTINNSFQSKNHHRTTIAACSVSSMMQFDTSFHLMAIYKIYFICIFMNINENLIIMTKLLDKLVPQWVIRPTLNPKEHFLLTSNCKMKPLQGKKVCFPIINSL